MVRGPATLLLALFAYALIGPALPRDPESNLPACCRRDGKHHCAMMDQQEPSSDDGMAAVKGKCPYFPGASVLPASTASAFQDNTSETMLAAVSHPRGHAQTCARYRISFTRAWQKRGPPHVRS